MLGLDVHTAFGTGMMVGFASMLSIGPNNLMLIREGLRRGYAGTVATTVYANYLGLGLATYALADVIADVPPQLRLVLSWLGPVAVAVFAVQALRTAMTPAGAKLAETRRRDDRAGSVRRAMLTVWCNPLTYLERLIVPAVLCTSMAGSSRAAFIAALLIMGAVCCYGYACSGGFARTLIRHDKALRSFDLVSGLLLAVVAVIMGGHLVLQIVSPA